MSGVWLSRTLLRLIMSELADAGGSSGQEKHNEPMDTQRPSPTCNGTEKAMKAVRRQARLGLSGGSTPDLLRHPTPPPPPPPSLRPCRQRTGSVIQGVP